LSDLFDEPYFAAATAPPRLPESHAEKNLREVLANQAFKTVSETVKRWNAALRTEVRAVTALKLTDDSGRMSASVPVSVVDGMPKSLAEATSSVEPWQWWLILNRPALEQTDRGLKLVVDEWDLLNRHISDISQHADAVHNSRNLVASILTRSIEKSLLERFGKIEEDILGAYWIHASKIQLYWMPLAVFAPLFDVSLSTLTTVVLCHELVHAYTHRGLDIDGTTWQTHDFVNTDVFVKEGLAQYYTERVMHELQTRLPDGLETFQKKTSHQAAPYTAYKNWLGKEKQPTPEVARLAMLEFRNANPPKIKHEEFKATLARAQTQIGR
jgi:hypothetical protein